MPEPIKTSLNDFPGFVVLAAHGKEDTEVVRVLASAFQAAEIPVKIESVKENLLAVGIKTSFTS